MQKPTLADTKLKVTQRNKAVHEMQNSTHKSGERIAGNVYSVNIK